MAYPQGEPVVSSDRVGRYLVFLGVTLGGSLGVLALVTLMVTSVEPGSLSVGLGRAGGGPVTALLLAILVAFVVVLVQMIRGGTVALGCGGLLGLVMTVVGIGSVVFVGSGSATVVADDMTGVASAAFVFAMAVAGPALAVGALLRLRARRRPPPVKRAGL